MHVAHVAILQFIGIDNARDSHGNSRRDKAIAHLQSSSLCQHAAHQCSVTTIKELAHRSRDHAHSRSESLLCVDTAHAAKDHHIETRAAVGDDDLHRNCALDAGNRQNVLEIAFGNATGEGAETIGAIDDESGIALVGGRRFLNARVHGSFDAEQKHCDGNAENRQRRAQRIAREHAQRKHGGAYQLHRVTSLLLRCTVCASTPLSR